MNAGLGAEARRYVLRLMAVAALSDRPVCFDSAPLIDYASGREPMAALLTPVLTTPGVPIVVSAVTLAEVVARPAALNDDRRVRAIYRSLLAVLRLRIVPLTEEHALETAYVRGTTGLKLPDAAIVATARIARASALVGNDRQWRGKPLGVPYHHLDDILALP